MMHRKSKKTFFKKLNEVKIGNKNDKQKKVMSNLNKFDHSREEVLNFFKYYTKVLLMIVTK